MEELRSKIEILSHEKKDLFASSIEKSKSLGTLDLMIRTLEETPIFEIEKPLEKKKTKQKKHLTVIK